MRGRGWIALTALAWSLPSGCNVFRKTTECTVNLDCPRGSVCADGNYCQTDGPILIGYLAAKTGPQAPTTTERRQAIDFGQWVVERDPTLKVLGRGVLVRDDDDLGSVTEVPAATTRLLNTNIAALIGPGASAEVLEAQKQTFARRMLHLAPSGAAPSLGDAQPHDLHQRFLFQMVVGVPGFVPTVPMFLASGSRPPAYDACFDGIALVTSDDTLGVALNAQLPPILKPNCLPVTAQLTVPFAKKEDYSGEVNALIAAANGGTPTRCVFLGIQTDVAGALLNTLTAREATGTRAPYNAFIGGGTLNDTAFFGDAQSAIAGQPSLAEGFYGIDADANPDRVELRDLEALWSQYLKTQNVLDPNTPIGPNRVSYAEAMIVVQLAIELAGSVDDPVALRDAFVDVTGHDEGDQIFGPANIPAAFAFIRAARQDGRRAAIDYRGSYSNLDFDPEGFVGTGTMVWHAAGGQITRVTAFSEEQVAAFAAATVAAGTNPGPACAGKPLP